MVKREPTETEIRSSERIIELINEYCDGSQQRFSEKVKINKASVSQYVHRTNFPSNIRCGQIAEAFHINPAWVMGFNVPKELSKSMEKTVNEQRIISKFFRLNEKDQIEVEKIIDLKLSMSDSVE